MQSSTAHDGFASRAVDGNYKFHWSDKSCTHTNDEVDPWWRVDLGKEYIITGGQNFVYFFLLRCLVFQLVLFLLN